MVAAADLSRKLGLIDLKLVLRIKNLLKLYGLPVKLKNIPATRIIRAHYHDKKFSGKENKFILIDGLGSPRIVRNIKLNLIKEAVGGLL
jgi:3-dehydroquinate synthase